MLTALTAGVGAPRPKEGVVGPEGGVAWPRSQGMGGGRKEGSLPTSSGQNLEESENLNPTWPFRSLERYICHGRRYNLFNGLSFDLNISNIFRHVMWIPTKLFFF